jgi:hypothetical protein
MKPGPRHLAGGTVALAFLFLCGTVALAVANHHPGDLASIPQVSAFALIGLLITRARPQNAVGWLFCALALLIAELLCARNYALYSLRTAPGSLPGGDTAAWLGVWPIELTTGLIAAALILFPHGSPPTRRWRVVLWIIAIETAVQTLLSFGWDVNLTQPYNFPEAASPLSLPGPGSAQGLYGALQMFSVLWLLIAVVAMVRRYGRAGQQERAQLKWVMYSMAALGGGMVAALATLDYKAVVVFTLVSPLIPLSAGVAIMRYRLYDIDRLINRTAVYALVTGLLLAAYLGLVLLIQTIVPLGDNSSVAVTISTLAIAALFRPLRINVQKVVDRRFNRSRYDATKTLQEFSVRARDEVDLDALSAALLTVVGKTMNPKTASIWLRPPTSTAQAAADPRGAPPRETGLSSS